MEIRETENVRFMCPFGAYPDCRALFPAFQAVRPIALFKAILPLPSVLVRRYYYLLAYHNVQTEVELLDGSDYLKTFALR